MIPRTIACWAMLLTLVGGTACGQGVLVSDEAFPLPRPHITTPAQTSYRVSQLKIEGRVHDQLADIQVSQTFHNCGNRVIEAQFVFPLPEDGAIDQLTLMVDGHELSGKLLSRDEARRRYEAIVRASRDPALLEWIGFGMFQTSVFPIPPGQTRTVTLHYSQLLKKDHELTEFLFPLSTAKYTAGPIEELSVNLSLENSAAIKNIYSPTHDVSIERKGKKRALISLKQQHVVPTSDFRLYFDARDGEVGTSLLTYREEGQDGYFLFLASPDIQSDADRVAKTVLFVVDKSGSMSGQKMEQAREALKFVLNNLRPGDLFNIVAYDARVESFRPELERYSPESREEALAFVDGLYAGGGTNIYAALQEGLSMLKDPNQPTYVLFLTDGRPTNGNTNETQIAANARQINHVHARMMTFGVGHDVNSRLLDRLSREGFGISEYVTPEEDIEEHVARVYGRISSPVLSQAQVEFIGKGSPKRALVNRLYPGDTFDLFEGEQLVVVGRYPQPVEDVEIKLTGRLGNRQETFTFHGELSGETSRSSHAFIVKLWATRRIGELIDELDLNGRNQELIDELVLLSTQHGIMTPYTSFLADETSTPTLAQGGAAFRSNGLQASGNLEQLEAASGYDAFNQRAAKQLFKQADREAPNALDEFTERKPAGEPGSAPASTAPVSSIVRNSGVQTLYKRGKIVVTPETADLQLERDKDQIESVTRFSTEYFNLVAANTIAENNLLSQQRSDEELLVKLRGQVYLIK